MPIKITDINGGVYEFLIYGGANGKCGIDYRGSCNHSTKVYEVELSSGTRIYYGTYHLLPFSLTINDVVRMINKAIGDIDAIGEHIPFIYETMVQCLQTVSGKSLVHPVHFRTIVM